MTAAPLERPPLRRIGPGGEIRQLLVLPRLLARGEGGGDMSGCGGDVHHLEPSFALGHPRPSRSQQSLMQRALAS